jgi:NAD+-dependent protein deacetylase SIR2
VAKLRTADLLIVIGTSLTVHPFASLTRIVPDECPRVLINMDRAGDIGSRADDVFLPGKCDEVIRELCEALGPDWVEDLDAAWKETEKYASKEVQETAEAGGTETTAVVKDEKEHAESRDLHDEVEKLTQQVEKALQIGKVPTDGSSPSAKEEAETVKDTKVESVTTATEGNTAASKASVEQRVAPAVTTDETKIEKVAEEKSNQAEGKL